MNTQVQFLRRKDAAEYLKTRYGFCSASMLALLAHQGRGPAFRKASSRVVLYEPAALDEWALAQISEPRTSTAKAGEAAE
jgi:hypothetical protein